MAEGEDVDLDAVLEEEVDERGGGDLEYGEVVFRAGDDVEVGAQPVRRFAVGELGFREAGPQGADQGLEGAGGPERWALARHATSSPSCWRTAPTNWRASSSPRAALVAPMSSTS
jgi:hypothetical protein